MDRKYVFRPSGTRIIYVSTTDRPVVNRLKLIKRTIEQQLSGLHTLSMKGSQGAIAAAITIHNSAKFQDVKVEGRSELRSVGTSIGSSQSQRSRSAGAIPKQEAKTQVLQQVMDLASGPYTTLRETDAELFA